MPVEIIAQLARKNGANFPLVAAEDIIGAFATVASTSARDAIPTAILRTGAIVRISNTSAYYEWTGSAWASVSFGGGGGSGDVVGPASSVSGQLAAFSGTTGKLLADSGFSTTAVAPAAVTKATAVAGTATSFSRSDHKHDVTTAAPGAFSVSGVSAAEGSASTLARSDHTHSLTGTLPVANGGTGLTALGTALFYLRVNAAGTALEYASVAAGVTAGNGLTDTAGTFSVDAADATLVVGAAGVKRAPITGDVTIADGSNVAAITADSIVNADVNTAAAIAGSKIAPAFTSPVTITPPVATSGSPRALTVTGAAHTTLAASTEAPDVDWLFARTVQFATGALATQRAVKVTAPTYGFVGASVLTTAATLAISGAPVAGTNATITNSYAFWVEAGAVRLGALGAGLVQASATGVLSSSYALGNNSLTAVRNISLTAVADGSTGASKTIDFTAGPFHSCTLNSASVALTFTPPGAGHTFQLLIEQDATGNRKVSGWTVTGRTVVWTSGGGSPPRLKTTSAAPPDIVFGYDDGTICYLSAAVPSPGPIVGTDLVSGTQTIDIGQGNHRVLPKSTTAALTTINLHASTGTPKVDEVLEVVVFAQAHNVVFHDNGAGVDTYTILAGERYAVHHKWDSVGWRKAGLFRMAGT